MHAQAATPAPVRLALTGLMGAGKTTTGRACALALRVPFVDLDELLEGTLGTTVAAYFREHGEAAFRAHEAAAIRRVLAGEGGWVIALGGGTLTLAGVREAIAESGARLVWLRVSPDVAALRVAGDGVSRRPLLAGSDPRARLTALLREREPLYAQADEVVETEGRSVDAIVRSILTGAATHAG